MFYCSKSNICWLSISNFTGCYSTTRPQNYDATKNHFRLPRLPRRLPTCSRSPPSVQLQIGRGPISPSPWQPKVFQHRHNVRQVSTRGVAVWRDPTKLLLRPNNSPIQARVAKTTAVERIAQWRHNEIATPHDDEGLMTSLLLLDFFRIWVAGQFI